MAEKLEDSTPAITISNSLLFYLKNSYFMLSNVFHIQQREQPIKMIIAFIKTSWMSTFHAYFLNFKKKLCSLPHMYTLALFICADIFLVNEMNGGALWSYRTKKGKKRNKSKDKREKAWLTAFNRDLSLHFTGSEWIFESILPKEQLFKTLNQLASQIIWTDAPQNTLEVFIYLFIF